VYGATTWTMPDRHRKLIEPKDKYCSDLLEHTVPRFAFQVATAIKPLHLQVKKFEATYG